MCVPVKVYGNNKNLNTSKQNKMKVAGTYCTQIAQYRNESAQYTVGEVGV